MSQKLIDTVELCICPEPLYCKNLKDLKCKLKSMEELVDRKYREEVLLEQLSVDKQ